MAHIDRLDTRRSVLIEPAGENIAKARFFWPFVQPNKQHPPYSIDITPKLVVALDSRFPIIPTEITLTDKDMDSRNPLESIVGKEISDIMYHAEEVGAAVVPFTLSEQGRLLIARLQIESVLTPPHIRDADNLVLG